MYVCGSRAVSKVWDLRQHTTECGGDLSPTCICVTQCRSQIGSFFKKQGEMVSKRK